MELLEGKSNSVLVYFTYCKFTLITQISACLKNSLILMEVNNHNISHTNRSPAFCPNKWTKWWNKSEMFDLGLCNKYSLKV